MKQLMTKSEVAQFIGISKASVRNWVRHGYITEINSKFDYNEIVALKKKIELGGIDRLNKRANKSKSSEKFIPTEYISSKKSIDKIFEIVEYISEKQIIVEKAIFLLALNLFIRTNDIKNSSLNTILNFNEIDFKRKGVLEHLKSYFDNIQANNFNDNKYKFIIDFELPDERDILGVIYQSIIHEGQKSNLGSYYTPVNIVKSIVDKNVNSDSVVLDPCCGTGQFLLEFCKNVENPRKIYGFDVEPNATFIAATNLLLFFKKIDFNPKIKCINTLLVKKDKSFFDFEYKFEEKFDFIATNPPWGAKYEKNIFKSIKQNFPEINNKESFSFFIVQSYRFLKKEGKMGFVLPESISSVRTHSEIRKFILKNTQIQEISILGKCFKNVFSSVISIVLQKKKVKDSEILLTNKKNKYTIAQNRFLKNKHYIFDIYITPSDYKIFSKMYNIKHFTLEGKADWALGIVTGDNKKFIQTNLEKQNSEPIFKGADVEFFKLKEASNYIVFEPEKFQQVASVEKYRAEEKLVYKFISSNLVFAYDNKKRLTLNSANILIPKIDKFSVKLILGFLNSKLYNYYYKKKFNSIKILRGDIEQLPIPVLSEKQKQEIELIVSNIINKKQKIEDLDLVIFDFFKISQEQQNQILKYLEKK